MRYRVEPAGLQELFATVQSSSWRWECQGDYAVDHAELEAWLRGEPMDSTDDDREWLAYIRGLARMGIPFERVRRLTEPLTDYLRWMLDITNANVDAGEDIRWVEPRDAEPLGMPSYDFYIFDQSRVVILWFDDQHELSGIDVDDDPEVVAQHEKYRDRVWPKAIPHRQYIAHRDT